MQYQHKLVVFVDSFNLPDNNTIQTLKQLREISEHVLLLVEYKDSAPNADRPLTSSMREHYLHMLIDNTLELDNIHIRSVDYHPYNTFKVGKDVFGSISDVSTCYYDYFNMCDCVLYIPKSHNKYLYENIGLTTITPNINYQINTVASSWYVESTELTKHDIPPYIIDSLTNLLFTLPKHYHKLRDEYNIIRKYKKAWEAAPYPPTFVTVDAIIIQANHILLIQRKAAPGKDLWALPGGFLNQEETIIDGMIRELREETKIKVAEKVLKGSIVKQQVFDAPDRSARGRTITHAFLIQLSGSSDDLPRVKGCDDAKHAKWISLSTVINDMRPHMFEDHLQIIETLTSISK